jgi:hypothetical protein
MRGEDRTTGASFASIDVEARIAADRPLRRRTEAVVLVERDHPVVSRSGAVSADLRSLGSRLRRAQGQAPSLAKPILARGVDEGLLADAPDALERPDVEGPLGLGGAPGRSETNSPCPSLSALPFPRRRPANGSRRRPAAGPHACRAGPTVGVQARKTFRLAKSARPAKPSSANTQVDGSGTAATLTAAGSPKVTASPGT